MSVSFIVALAWIYVVLMMSISETSIIAGLMTFFLYGVLPLGVVLYLLDAPRRRKNLRAASAAAREHVVKHTDTETKTDDSSQTITACKNIDKS